MADFTPVLPASVFSLLDPPHQSRLTCLGSTHFLHAHQLLGVYGDDIVWRYKDRGCTFIIDCFAYENSGQIPDTNAVYEVAQLLKGKIKMIIICPDVMLRPDLTMDLLRQHGPALGGYGRLMIVPHGVDIVSWMSNCEYMVDFCFNVGITQPYVGIPRYVTGFSPEMETRHYLATWLGTYYPYLPIHLLGAGNGLAEAAGAALVPNVQSCDSTLPFAWALTEGVYDDPTAKVEMPTDAWDMSWMDLVEYEDGHGDALKAFAQLNIANWKWRFQHANSPLRL